jgi:TolB-like protein/DNA-binding winged helix-turn-helix (wHTH) protein/tetratricopeptide (TPR) repeat protein
MPEEPSTDSGGAVVRFEGFALDSKNYTLRRGTEPIRLRPQAFKVLALLVARAGDLVTREEIRRQVWGPDTFVDFNSGLNLCIKQIREALGDPTEEPRFIETVPRLGSRFIAPIECAAPPPVAGPAQAPAPHVPVGLPQAPHAPATHAAPAFAPAVHAPAGDGPAPPPEFPRPTSPPRSRRTLTALVTAAIVVAVLGAGITWALRRGARSPQTGRPTVEAMAVLPLVNLSRDPETAYFADGMTEALINDLARMGTVRVISRTSVEQYRDTRKRLPEIARELGVGAVVEGSVLHTDEHVRISVQLVDGRTDQPLWASSYERSRSDVLALQREVADGIAGEIHARIAGSGARPPARPVDPATYEAYLRGRFFWNKRTNEGLQKAIEHFNDAIARSPDYAPAYAGLADAYLMGPGLPIPLDDVMAKARAAASRAIDLDPDLAEAYASIGLIKLTYDWDFAAAGAALERAVALNPGYATGRQWRADQLAITGRLDEALAEIRRAHALDPLSQSISRDVGRILYYSRRHPEAIEQLRRTLELDASFRPARFVLGFAYSKAGRHAEAVELFDDLVRGWQAPALFKAGLAYACARAGDAARAREILRELGAGGRPPAYEMALIHLGLGDTTETLAALDRAYEARSYRLIYLGPDPIFDPLRGDPRFRTLLARIGSAAGDGPSRRP